MPQQANSFFWWVRLITMIVNALSGFFSEEENGGK